MTAEENRMRAAALRIVECTEICRQPLSQSADSHCYLDRSSICLAYARARAHATLSAAAAVSSHLIAFRSRRVLASRTTLKWSLICWRPRNRPRQQLQSRLRLVCLWLRPFLPLLRPLQQCRTRPLLRYGVAV